VIGDCKGCLQNHGALPLSCREHFLFPSSEITQKTTSRLLPVAGPSQPTPHLQSLEPPLRQIKTQVTVGCYLFVLSQSPLDLTYEYSDCKSEIGDFPNRQHSFATPNLSPTGAPPLQSFKATVRRSTIAEKYTKIMIAASAGFLHKHSTFMQGRSVFHARLAASAEVCF
jgi:hypothetical protein